MHHLPPPIPVVAVFLPLAQNRTWSELGGVAGTALYCCEPQVRLLLCPATPPELLINKEWWAVWQVLYFLRRDIRSLSPMHSTPPIFPRVRKLASACVVPIFLIIFMIFFLNTTRVLDHQLGWFRV